MNVFPTLFGRKFIQVNLAEEAQKRDKGDATNPYFSVENQNNLLEEVRKQHGADHTFGGYLEDRSMLWRDFESSSKHMIHLGVDVNNLEPGTLVAVPCDCEVIHVMQDETKINGWGGRVILRLKEPFQGCSHLLVGHLASIPKLGKRFFQGECFARVGETDTNGGWFAHVHFQLVKDAMMDYFKENLNLIDGYLLDQDIDSDITAEMWSADPTTLLLSQ